MPKIRIQATETVHYEKESEVDQETLDHFVEMATSGERVESSDLNLDPHDINSGEMESDDIDIDVFVDGKWRPVVPA